jgi:sugar diacid utilization regulator
MAHAPGAGEAAGAVREALWVADLRERLLARLAAVRARRQLWTTLRALYDCDLDRGRTARWLGIHRSTLDYRLNCVQRLIGISPTSVRGIVLLSTGLAADSLGP